MNALSSQLTKFAAVSLAGLLLASCGGDEAKQASIEPASGPFAKPKAEPVVEEKDPYVAELSELDESDRADYLSVDEGLNIMRLYVKNHPWDEAPDDVGDSFSFPGVSGSGNKAEVIIAYEDLDESLAIAGQRYKTEKDVFAKRDYAAALKEMVAAESAKVGDKRLVKAAFDARSMGIAGYSFDSKSFKISSCMLVEKVELSAEDLKKGMRMGGSLPCSKGYIYNSLASNYKFGFKDADWLSNLVIEDEQAARAIEKMRGSGSVVFYGYVAEVSRDSRGKGEQRELKKDRKVEVVPHFVDFMDGDKVVYTARKS